MSIATPCPSVSIGSQFPCDFTVGHSGLHGSAAGCCSWVDPDVDVFPNGLVVHGDGPASFARSALAEARLRRQQERDTRA